MSVKIIPENGSAVVDGAVQTTYVSEDRDRERGHHHSDDHGHLHTLNGLAGLERSTGFHSANSEGHNGQRHADLERSGGLHHADNVKTVKDAEAGLERSSGTRFGEIVKTIKDSEAELERSSGTRFGETVKTVKDAEVGLERSSGSRFSETLKTIKDTEVGLEKSDAFTRDVVRQSELATEKAKGFLLDKIRDSEKTTECAQAKISDLIRDFQFENCKELDGLKVEVLESKKEILVHQVANFKDLMIESKVSQNLALQLAAAAEKTAFTNQLQTMLQLKDQACLSERLAAQAAKEMAECCCEMKALVNSDGQKTRDLINTQELQDLRDRAVKAEQKLLLLQCCSTPAPTGSGLR